MDTTAVEKEKWCGTLRGVAAWQAELKSVVRQLAIVLPSTAGSEELDEEELRAAVRTHIEDQVEG